MSIYQTGRLASTSNARNLRKYQTPEENKLWRELRNRRFSAFKFRRQQPIGRYITDFMCSEIQIIIEADGAHHDVVSDKTRDEFLRTAGYRVLRFSNYAINSRINSVLENIWTALNDVTFDPNYYPSPAPCGALSPCKGEGK